MTATVRATLGAVALRSMALFVVGCATPHGASEPSASKPTDPQRAQAPRAAAEAVQPSAAPSAPTSPSTPDTDEDLRAIDFKRYASVESLCHPKEDWDTKKGCVPRTGAPKVRCGGVRDEREASSCSPNDLQCVMRLVRRAPRKRLPDWEEPATAAEIADCTTQCEGGHAPSCLRLAMAQLRGPGVARDVEAGIRRVEQSCRDGYAPACAEAFHLYQWQPQARTHSLARRLVEFECRNDPQSFLPCSQAAKAYAHGWGVTQDLQRARDLRAQACKLIRASCGGRFTTLDDDARPRAIERCIDEAAVCDPGT